MSPVAPLHKHDFKLHTHIDGCHFYSSVYTCDCGEAISVYDEREFTEDPYSFCWIDETCERCAELMNGAESKHEQERHAQ